ncbi:MAG: hypothetical protein LBF74_09040 [Treponema sp.]|jgi:hypothetical protein|nr:hypothetical protein [Treponema sp.]
MLEAGKLKRKVLVLWMVFITIFCFAEEEALRIIPLLNYEFVSLEDQQYHAPGGGLLVLYDPPPLSEKNNNLLIGIFYKPYILKEIPPGYSEIYHDVDFIIEKKTGRHLIQGIFTAYSDKPVYGGLHTTYSSIGYGYELIRKENLNLTLGLSLGFGDFGINLPNGTMWPVIPQPIVKFAFNSRYINLVYDYPEFQFVILPDSRVRITGTVGLDTFSFYDIHDLRFNSILWYRFFNKNFSAGDFLGIGLGVQNAGQNDGTDFVLGKKDRKYDMNYYSVFGVVDAGLVKISGGYIPYSREVYDKDYSKPTGRGFFVKVEMLYQF